MKAIVSLVWSVCVCVVICGEQKHRGEETRVVLVLSRVWKRVCVQLSVWGKKEITQISHKCKWKITNTEWRGHTNTQTHARTSGGNPQQTKSLAEGQRAQRRFRNRRLLTVIGIATGQFGGLVPRLSQQGTEIARGGVAPVRGHDTI